MIQLKLIDTYKEKVKIAIERIKSFEDMAIMHDENGYVCTFSGGKDSIACYGLLKSSNVKHYSQYSVTGLDFPDLIYNIKKNYKDVKFIYPKLKDNTNATMWKLIVKKYKPPTRINRYCCDYLKETLGKDKFIITGVRWHESKRRENTRSVIENYHKNKKYRYRTDDNEEGRMMLENCMKKGKYTLNPIIDWTDEDVWNFINYEGLKYPKLYDKGYKRLGCIGCPMSCNQEKEINLFPKIKSLYLKAFKEMLKNRKETGRETEWKNEYDVMDWYLGKQVSIKKHKDQLSIQDI